MSLEELKSKMHNRELYFADDQSLVQEQIQCLEILYDFNHSRPSESERREKLLKSFFAEFGKGSYIEPPLNANWGRNTHVGNNVYANFNLTLVDDTDIFIGDHVMFGPNVTLATAGHPVEPGLRKNVGQFNVPIRICENVWIGAGTVVLPGVTIGENSVIGAGSIVTRDIPSNVVAMGNPCRVIRSINDRDREFYYRDMRIAPEFKELILM